MSVKLIWFAISMMFGTTGFAQDSAQDSAQDDDKALCGNTKDIVLKYASRTEAGATAFELGLTGRYCAGTGYLQLAEEAFDAGRLADASRYVSAAVRLVDGNPATAKLLVGALRIQGAIYVERGMLSEALALIERLKALPVESPEQSAVVRGLAGACYQAAGDHRAAEREYVQAIQLWDSLRRSEDAVSERSNLGVLYLASRRFDEAVAVLERAHELLAASGKNAAYYRLVLTNNLAVAYSERGDTPLAVRHARAAIRLAEATKVGRYQLTASVYSNSAGVLRAAGHKKEANDLDYRAGQAEAIANSIVDLSDLGAVRPRRP